MNYRLLLGLFIVSNLVVTGETNWKTALLCVTLVYVFLNWKTILIMIKIFPRDVSLVFRAIKLISELRKIINNNDSVITGFHRVLKKGPKKVCFYFEDQAWTYQDVEDYSNKIANIFLDAGFKKGDTVALLMGNCPEYVGTWLGLAKLGICTALINTNLRQKSLAHCVSIVSPKAIIYTDDFVGAINDVPELFDSGLQKYHFHGENINDTISLPSVSKDYPKVADPLGYKDQLLYIYTSGTTGLPKAAKIPHLKYYIFANAVYYMTNMTENDIIYDPLPMYHSSGGALAIGPALLKGNPVVLRSKFSASAYLTDCIKFNCTIGFYIGEMCRYIMNTPPQPTDRQHKVRVMFGAGMNPWIWTKFVERFGVGVVELYGSTEGTVSVGNVTSKIGSIGFLPRWLPKSLNPIAIIKFDEATGTPIRDEKGFCMRCEFGEPGMFIGTAVQDDPVKKFHGYVDPVASNSKLIHNVFKKGDTAYVSGDVVVMDEEGYIYFKDRTGDTFRWKSENVSTTEVESVISDVIGFRDCTVYGVKVGILEGRAGMAAIADPDNEVDLNKLADGIEAALPSYAQPLFIRIMASIPKTGTYKLRKLDLRDEGFNPSVITDKLYFHQKSTHVPIDTNLYDDIMSGKIRL